MQPVRYVGHDDVTEWLARTTRRLPAIVPDQPDPGEVLVGLAWDGGPRLYLAETAVPAMVTVDTLWYTIPRDLAESRLQ
jgi:hypothetical protein